MRDIAAQLRTVVDRAASPVEIDEVRGRFPRRRTRRKIFLAAAVVIAVALIAAAVVTRHSDRASVRVTTPPSRLPTGWTQLPDSPLGSRAGHVMAWTGHE